MSMYTGAKTVIGTVCGNSIGFEVNVRMHQGSALTTLLFGIVMEAMSGEFRVALPWELLYADDLAVTAETEEEVIKKLGYEEMHGVRSKGSKIKRKTKEDLERGC